jgi:osmotically-inducible protein OsmY
MLTRTLIRNLTLFAAICASTAHASDAPPTTDRQITNQVEQLIRQHPELGSQLAVQTRGRVVYIAGTPWERFATSNLEFIVRQTEGVADVIVTAVYPEN